ncbi:MAG: hypothetical protein AAF628_18470 [Planctomycetota bacterium]
MRLAVTLTCALLATVTATPAAAQATAPPSTVPQAPAVPSDLTDANWAAWAAHVRGDEGERAWARLPWEPSFHEGLQAAAAQGKPLLLWTMNGHPLGCT